MKKLPFAWFIGLFVLLLIVAGVEYIAYYGTPSVGIPYIEPVAVLPTYTATPFEEKFYSSDFDDAIAIAQVEIASSTGGQASTTAAMLHLAMAYEQKGSIDAQAVTSLKDQQSLQKEFGQKAIDTVKKVLILDPTNSEAYRVIGFAYELLGQYKNAQNAYTASIIYYPQSAVTFVQRGHLEYTQGQLDQAYADYMRAYDINPKNTLLNLDLALYFYGKSDIERTHEFASFAVASTPIVAISSAASEFKGFIDTTTPVQTMIARTMITVEDSHGSANDGWCVLKTGALCTHVGPSIPKATGTPLVCKAPTVNRFGSCVEICPDGTMKDANLNPTCSLSAIVCPDAAHVFPASYNQPLPDGAVRAVGPYAKCTIATTNFCSATEIGQSCSTGACAGQNDGTLMCTTKGLSCQPMNGFVCNSLIKTFNASPEAGVTKNQTCLLRWNTNKAVTCSIVDGAGKVLVSETSLPDGAASTTAITKNKTYTLSCTDKNNRSVSKSVYCNLR